MRRSFLRNAPLLLIASLALSSAAWAQKASAPQTSKAKVPPTQVSGKSAVSSPKGANVADAYYHYMLAHEYEEMSSIYGRPEYAEKALKEYHEALADNPDSKYLKSHLSELYFQTGRIKDAIVAAQQEVKANPNDLEAHKLLARIYLQSISNDQQDNQMAQQMLNLAIGEYQKITALEPNKIPDHIMLGRLYAANHQMDKAEAEFQKAYQIDPSSEETILSVARFYSEQGNNAKAIATLKGVSAADQTPRIEYALGLSYDQLKETPKAITAYQRALQLDPDNPEIEKPLAKDLFAAHQFDQALQVYQDLVASEPNNGKAYLRISDIERHDGRFQQAYNNLMKAKAITPDSVEIAYDQGLLADALGHFDEAEGIFKKLVAISDHPSNIYSPDEKSDRYLFLDRLASIYREQNKVDQAIGVYEKMAMLGKDYAERAYQSEVDTYGSAHEYAKAEGAAQEAVQKMPNDQSMKLLLAGEMADNGKVQDALKLEKSLLTGKPDDRAVYLSMAQIETRLNHWKQASNALKKAEKLAKTNDDKVYVDFLRGVLEEREGHLDNAEAEFRKVLSIDPTNSITLNYLGYMMADRDENLPQALAMIQKAVKLDPLNYAYLDSLGWAYFKMGNFAEAEKNLRQACERDSTDPTVHDHLGQLYEKTGHLKKAAEQWELSLTEFAHTLPADAEPGELGKVQKRLDRVRVRLAKETPSPAVTPQ